MNNHNSIVYYGFTVNNLRKHAFVNEVKKGVKGEEKKERSGDAVRGCSGLVQPLQPSPFARRRACPCGRVKPFYLTYPFIRHKRTKFNRRTGPGVVFNPSGRLPRVWAGVHPSLCPYSPNIFSFRLKKLVQTMVQIG